MKVIACRGIAFYTELSVAYKSAFSITNSTLWTKEINGWNEIEIYFDLRPTLNHWSLQRSISSQRNSVNVAVLYVTVYRCWVISMKFKDLRKATKKRLTIAHDNYLLDLLKTDDMDLETRKPTITKRFWTYIRSKRQDNVGVTPLVINDDVVSDSREKANLLSNYFKSVFTKEDLQNMPPLKLPARMLIYHPSILAQRG